MWYCVWLDHQQTSNYICIEVAYGRGRPIDSHKCLCLQTMTTDSENAGICKQLGYQKIWQCVTRCVCVKTEVGLLRYHSQHYTITAITKWLERLAFLVLVWVEKKSSKRHKDLTCMNINNKLITVTATATTRECLPSETWLAVPIFKDVTCVPNVLVWYTVIWNL